MGVCYNNNDNSGDVGDDDTGGGVRDNVIVDDHNDNKNVRRYQPRKGFFTLIDQLIDDLPATSSSRRKSNHNNNTRRNNSSSSSSSSSSRINHNNNARRNNSSSSSRNNNNDNIHDHRATESTSSKPSNTETQNFAGNVGVRVVSKDQIVALDRRQKQQQQDNTNDNEQRQLQCSASSSWFLRDAGNVCHGPYDVVLFAYDSNPRAARKASFKQLLESALPISSNIIKSLSRAVSASAMTAIVSFSQRTTKSKSRILHDCIRFEGIPALRFATRNRTKKNGSDAASHRGMTKTSDDDDVWTLVATPEWSYEIRKKSKKWTKTSDDDDVWTLVATPEWSYEIRKKSKKWNKKAVGDDIVKVFADAVGVPSLSSSYRSVVPTFHWQGSSSLTEIAEGEGKATTTTDDAGVKTTAALFAYDADSGLGFCGDVFGGQGVEGALRSAADIAEHLHLSPDTSQLPVTDNAWILRTPANKNKGSVGDNHDTNSVFGSFTGRDEPSGRQGPNGEYNLLDYTWPTAIDIVNGKSVESADSLAKYRRKRGNSRNNQRKNRSNNKKPGNNNNRSKQ
eukprot:CAMPEP_0194195936 /NCGR_PEP_ID=MMETSP0154-20130528/76398_1 /TAXON_ID=1049557 /ORGANISM="Thalassiothrix antarctica, Strain L6-D1" /LENGTH=564 /DNA_ID=CAMNT_0038920499 /DNA_START=417 /DNA_END=2111 /DNA_ORIENTATION=-